MKKKIIAAVTAAALLLAVLGAALAAPGDSFDPFVTLSYLTNTFLPKMEKDLLEQAQKATAETEKAAFDRLDALAGSYTAQAGGGQFADTFVRMTLSRNDRLDLPTGASILFEKGICNLVFASGSLIDVTAGKVITPENGLISGHRYIAAENTACSLTAVSDAVYLSVRGRYVSAPTGITHTPYTDLVKDDWYYDAVRFVYQENLISGATATEFSPNTNVNRAMVATALSRLDGLQSEVPAYGFTDVPMGQWYSNPINWAANVGVINGIGDGTFAPLKDVTREQFCAMLYRYAHNYLGLNVGTSGDMSVYSDRAKVNSYAEEAVAWAVGSGIMTGVTTTTLVPQGTATRAQMSIMLQRFCNLIR